MQFRWNKDCPNATGAIVLKSDDFIDYYAKERLQLNEKTITIILEQMKKAIPIWKELLEISFLSSDMKEKYLNLLETRIVKFE